MQLSICIAVYGRPESVEMAFSAFQKFASTDFPIVIPFTPSEDLDLVGLNHLIECYLSSFQVNVLPLGRVGIYGALNFGIKAIISDFFIFCHSDDFLIAPLSSDDLIKWRVSEYDIVTFPVFSDGEVIHPRINSDFTYDIGINHMCTIFRTDFHRNFLYNEEKKYSADWEAVIAMSQSGAKIQFETSIFMKFSTTGASSSVSAVRLYEDISILCNSKWSFQNFFPKFKRLCKEVLGYAYGKAKCYYNNL